MPRGLDRGRNLPARIMRSFSDFIKMRVFCIFRKGATAGAHPVDVCWSMDSARRAIKNRREECFIVVRHFRLEYGYSPETIEEQLEIRHASGRNLYTKVTPFKIQES